MFVRYFFLVVCLLAVITAGVANATDIPGVVAALNERAVPAIPDGLMEDGANLTIDDGPAAWTVGTPGPDGGCSIDVAVLAAATAAQAGDVVLSLTGDPRIASATAVLITTVTPTLAELQAFDAVLVFTNTTPLSSVALGDNLADYVDAGGGVVLTMFAIRASLNTRTIEGRFLTANYYCIERSVGASTTGAATLGTVHVPSSPLMAGVNTFNGGTSGFRTPAPPHALATRIADWSTGQVLIAERVDLPGGRVDLGLFAVSQAQSAGSWLTSTDGAIILRNAVVRASRCGESTPVEQTTWGAIKAHMN